MVEANPSIELVGGWAVWERELELLLEEQGLQVEGEDLLEVLLEKLEGCELWVVKVDRLAVEVEKFVVELLSMVAIASS